MVIITGVSSGLGRALFDTLRTTGVRLVCISRTFLDYQTALAGEDVALLACDLSKTDEVSSLVKKLDELLADTNDIVFINNAATIAPIGRVGELDDAAIHAAVQTNFVSPMLVTNMLCRLTHVLHLTLIHIGTGAAREPIAGWPLYCSTKAAAKMFFSVLQEQGKDDKRIAVHEFDPGVMDTPMQSQIRQSSCKDFPDVEEFKAWQQDGKLSDPAQVAKKLVAQYIPL